LEERRAASVVCLQKSLVERGQFLNRCDAEISTMFAEIAAFETELGGRIVQHWLGLKFPAPILNW
jgi:hypothetical protein